MNLLKAAVVAALATVAVLGVAGPAFGAAPYKPHLYGLTHFQTEASDTQAGGHPDVRADFGLKHVGDPRATDGTDNQTEAYGRTRRVEIDMPYNLALY